MKTCLGRYMAHSGGFEPPTARFVAEYSIQLSYECVSSLRGGAYGRDLRRKRQVYFATKIKKAQINWAFQFLNKTI